MLARTTSREPAGGRRRPTPMDATSPRLLLNLLRAGAGLALLVTLTACSGGGSDSVDGGGEAAEPAVGLDSGVTQDRGGRNASAAGSAEDATSPVERTLQEPALISTGTVSLRSDDVADTRFDVQKVADRYRGQVTDSETRTDEDGEVRDTRLVLRVPSAEFTEAMDELEKVADLESSTSTSEDVTNQVVDTEVRIRVQRASIARIEELLQRAGSIRDVVAVENQLTQRQERLDSLLRQQAYLEDQTSMSTITVHVERTDEAATEPGTDEAGFVPGLRAGWDGLTTVLVGLATVTGALLPFAALALLLGVPAWLVLRRRVSAARAGSPARTP
ncbi:DUF4349 domain-containing protein [Nocardioides sp. OK12]|uniref:DUF4349 domain-containing protein n=1 Tax=Nocardioides sp. OK12 TaxID=2758661 RepID=UPI0021C30431|nr:DUF4349 domain-containing protein [Nocardioides sp. OK12]